MRVAILAMGWTGYNDAACRHLSKRGVELLVVTPAASPDTAFTTESITDYAQLQEYDRDAPTPEIAARVASFRPDAILMHSWHYAHYREILRAAPAGTLRVLWMDNVWRNTAKQWIGRAVAPRWVQPLFDAVMVPSDRTEFFARRLGFGEGAVIRGSLSADTDLFGSPERDGAELAGRRRFLACLRLVEHKGADVLAAAYREYRELASDPWDLSVVGIGPLRSAFDDVPGVTLHDFQQPAAVAQLMREASCLVVPSREEPYGVVLHEGALSALPIVSTYFVGAAPFFVQDGQNGWTVPGGDATALARAMERMSSQDPGSLGEMSAISRGLGARISSPGWARNIDEQLRRRVADLREGATK